ncbi:hypothetical protein JOE25_000893 [Serratia sp. PL17]|uniref:hypothetical protein n=1 Tax=Serratia sp. PL17 TaxID=2806582 RepID=UPI001B593AAA|nr:hypothetical protein [Serratia sp. PL17]MBP1129350.1 hypothetical protein [Serratia sp. PL17]
MASSWIKVEVITPDKPEVYQLAELLELDPDAVLGKLIRLWSWADQQTIDGNADCNAVSVTKSAIDRITFVRGFAEAMLRVGWLALDGEKLIFPNFERHNGNSTKKRALTNRRVANLRDSQRSEAPNGNAQGVTKKTQKELPDEEEEEDIKDPPLPPKGNGEGQFDFNSIELPEWLSPEIWRQWGEFCIELGKPVKTKRAAMANIKRLEEFRQQGHSPDSVILHCIANDWKTLSPPLVSHPVSNFIDFDGAFNRLITSRKKPQNRAEEIAKEKYSKAGLRMAKEFECRNAWRGYLSLAYKETGEQPYVGG